MRALPSLIAALSLTACSQASQPSPPPPQFDRVSADLVEHGRRLSAVLGCSGCHGADLTGQDWSEPGFGRLWTSNLTRAVEGYSDAQLEATIRNGRRPDGSDLWAMPSHLFTHLSADDMAGVIAYLRSSPPRRRRPSPAGIRGGRPGRDRSRPAENLRRRSRRG